jgi:glycine cleavage system H protein
VRVEGDIATVGITDYAVEQLTDLVYVELPETGAEVKANETFGEIESVKAVSDLIAPVSGTVEEIHEALPDQLDILSSAPFTDGWMIKVKMSDPAEVDALMDLAAYEKVIAEAEG